MLLLLLKDGFEERNKMHSKRVGNSTTEACRIFIPAEGHLSGSDLDQVSSEDDKKEIRGRVQVAGRLVGQSAYDAHVSTAAFSDRWRVMQ